MVGLCVLGFIFCILQVSILRGLAIFQVTPDLILILLIYVALFRGKIAMWFGFAMGLFIDLYSATLGYNALVNTVIGYGIGSFAPYLYREMPVLWITILLGASLIHNFTISLAQREFSLFFFSRYIIPGSLYTVIVGLLLFSFLRRMAGKR